MKKCEPSQDDGIKDALVKMSDSCLVQSPTIHKVVPEE